MRGRVEERAARAAEKAEADKAAAAARRSEGECLAGILRERLAGNPVVRVGADGRVKLSFRYDADLVAVVRGLPGARFDGATKRWNVLAAMSSDVERIVAGAARIASGVAALDEAYAEALRSRASEAQARFAANPYRTERCADAPAVDDTWRLGRGEVVVVTSHGKRFRAAEDTSPLGGPVGADGEWCCRVYYRAATADEVAALETLEEAVRARARVTAEVRETVRRIDREGEPVGLGREPVGEVLLRNDRSAIVGFARRVVLDAEGGLWSVVYDGRTAAPGECTTSATTRAAGARGSRPARSRRSGTRSRRWGHGGMTLVGRVGRALYGEQWQVPMARALGVSRDTVQDWRTGRMRPRHGVLADLLALARWRQAEVGEAVADLEAEVGGHP